LLENRINLYAKKAFLTYLKRYQREKHSELVQLKLNIEASGGDSTPPEVETGGTPTYRSGRLAVGLMKFYLIVESSSLWVILVN